MSKRPGLGRATAGAAVLGALLAIGHPAAAQYPGQIQEKDKNGAPALRSVAVIEWTGTLAKPKSSRVIPISIWDGQQLQDAGIYLAQPQPMALDPEVEYELFPDGKKSGFFDIQNASETQGAWVGFGVYKPLPRGPSPAELAKMRAKFKIDADADDADSDKPILHRKHHDDDASNGSGQKGAAPDPDRPTLHKSSDDSGDQASNEPPPDPDRPRLHEDTDSSSGNSDPDRPKLNGAPAAGDDEAHVSSVASSGDPDRPTLKRGIPANYGTDVTPNLMGLPPEMQQEVAISDPRPIKDHPWDFTWANPDDQRKMKEALEEDARKALDLDQPPAPPLPAPKSKTAAAGHHSARQKPAPQPPPPTPLQDEQFRVLELTYGGGATMVFSAYADVTGPDQKQIQKFVTLVAQPDLYGSVVVLLKNVTDSAHLDLKPRMRLVDAVDALGDNRGELLFELRGQSQRQFTLYRVLRGTATQIFTTGAIFFGSGGE